MASNYTMTSAFLGVPEAQLGQAREICDRVTEDFMKDEDGFGYCGIQWKVENKGAQRGIRFSNLDYVHGMDDSANIKHMEIMAREVIEELKIDTPFQASWTCQTGPGFSSPSNNGSTPEKEFDSGSFVIVRGHPTIWVNAQREAEKQAAGLVAQDWPENDIADAMREATPGANGPTP